MSNTHDIEFENPLKKLFFTGLIGFLIVLLIGVSFYLGNIYACKDSGYTNNFKCVKPQLIPVCEFEGNKLLIPSNTPVEIKYYFDDLNNNSK